MVNAWWQMVQPLLKLGFDANFDHPRHHLTVSATHTNLNYEVVEKIVEKGLNGDL
jgi:hypothetical protein